MVADYTGSEHDQFNKKNNNWQLEKNMSKVL